MRTTARVREWVETALGVLAKAAPPSRARAPYGMDAVFGFVMDYARLHPVRAAAIGSLALATVLLAGAYLRHRRLRPALRLSGVLTLAAAGLALAYRGYVDRALPEEVPAVAHEPRSVFGIDVSHYQARVNWAAVADSEHPIEFVFVRATMGKDGEDERFRENWRGAGRQGFLRGAYHFYRPREDPAEQFENFARVAQLEPGDLLPVLDVEWRSRRGDKDLRKGVREWLDLAEAHYGVKPIIYTGASFYRDRLAGHFDEYPLWVAHYSDTPDTAVLDWRIHQFTDKVRVRGILERVDGNVFRGRLGEMEALRVR